MTSGEEVGRFLSCRPAETNQTIARRDESYQTSRPEYWIKLFEREEIFQILTSWRVRSECFINMLQVDNWPHCDGDQSRSVSSGHCLLVRLVSPFLHSARVVSLMTYFLAHSHSSSPFSRIADNCDLWLKACLDMFIKSPLNYWLDFSPLPDWGGRARTVGGSRLSDWVTIMQCMPGQAVAGPAWLESGEHW